MSVYDDNADLYGDDVPVQPKPTRHTLDCRHQQLRYSAWIAQWPLSCRKCGATGWLHDAGDRETPPNDEFCDKCLGKQNPAPFCEEDEHSYCPRCGEYGIEVGDDPCEAIECPHCGWAGGAGADDHMPEVDCHCWE
jgi:ribosomal protein S27E